MEDGVNVLCRCLDEYKGKFCEGLQEIYFFVAVSFYDV